MKQFFLLCAVLVIASCSKRETINANAMRDAFAESLQLSLKANLLSQPPEGQSSFKMSKAQEDQMLSLLDQTIKKAEELDPKFLAWLHAELPSAFKNKFIEGQKRYAQGIRGGNPVMQVDGNKLMMEWQTFWGSHKIAITEKMYPK